MALVSKPFTFTVGATIVASEHNSCFDVLYSDYNGNITNANISGSAAISDSKLANISSASKVSGAALTSLSSIPSGAGAIPAVNVTDFTLSGGTKGAIAYHNGFGWRGLAAGTSGYVLRSQGNGSDLIYGSAFSSIKDYGTSASSSTTRVSGSLYIAYGQFSFSANGSQAITNLPFSSSTSYAVTIGEGYGVTTTENIRVDNASGSQFTLYNDVNRACTVHWIAIGS